MRGAKAEARAAGNRSRKSGCLLQGDSGFSLVDHGGSGVQTTVGEFRVAWPSGFTGASGGSGFYSGPAEIKMDGVSSDDGSKSQNSEERKLGITKTSRLKRTGIPDLKSAVWSPGVQEALADVGVTARIIFDHTHNETIIHTDPTSFRDVVRQLTGPCCSDQELFPVTLRSRHAIRSANSRHQGNNTNVQRGETCGTPHSAPPNQKTKLFQRWKALNNLQNLSTTDSELPPLIPSPVTPLKSDSEKLCHATTPTTSQGSIAASSSDETDDYEDREIMQQQAIAEELAIAEKGFYLHARRLQNSGPMLLNLFPEFPACSPDKN